jgi:glutamine amidotransferase
MKVAVIDIGISNLKSLLNCLKFLGIRFIITNKQKEIINGTHIILPGVGTFDEYIGLLKKLDLVDCIKENVLIKKKPILGICAGMQVIFSSSDEGKESGLNFLNGKIERLEYKKGLGFKIPNVGFFNIVEHNQKGIFKHINTKDAFYFMHSFALKSCLEKNLNFSYSIHNDLFISAFEKENICGFQFHPEKSQISGIKILSNFFEK